MLIDLSGVDFIASMGIHMLMVSAARTAQTHGAYVALFSAQALVARVFDRTALTRVMTIVADREAALKATSVAHEARLRSGAGSPPRTSFRNRTSVCNSAPHSGVSSQPAVARDAACLQCVHDLHRGERPQRCRENDHETPAPPTGLFPTVAAAVLSIVAVVALAFVELMHRRGHQLDAVIQVASSLGGVDG